MANNSSQKPKPSLLDTHSSAHIIFCQNAGIIPGSIYACNFCEYLLNEVSDTSWYDVDNNGKYSFKHKLIKEHKKDWVKWRAGERTTEENVTSKFTVPESEALKEKTASSETLTEKISNLETKREALYNELYKLKNTVSKKEENLNTINNSAHFGVGALEDKESKKNFNETERADIESLKTEINDLNADIELVNFEITTLTEELNAEFAAIVLEKQKQEKAKTDAKGDEWWYKKLKSFRQEQFNAEAKKTNDKRKKVEKEYDTEDLIKLAVYANKLHNGENSNYPYWTYFDNKDNNTKKELNIALENIWKKYPSATSIRNDINKDILAEAESLTPDASTAMLSGAVSNTFRAAAMARELCVDHEFIDKRATLTAAAVTAATVRYTTRVTACILGCTAQILDVTPIMQIPIDASAEMLNHILTPAQIMQIIADMLNDDAVTGLNSKKLDNFINKQKEAFNDKVQEINYLYANKLNAFNEELENICTIINQGPDWYLDNINKIELAYEKETIKMITDKTAAILDSKFQYRDKMVETISNQLVTPVNEALIAAQLQVIRLLAQAIKYAEQLAIAAAQAALMALLGLLGI